MPPKTAPCYAKADQFSYDFTGGENIPCHLSPTSLANLGKDCSLSHDREERPAVPYVVVAKALVGMYSIT